MAKGKQLSGTEVLALMKKDGKTAEQLSTVKSKIDGKSGVYSVSTRTKVKIPSGKSKFYAYPGKNDRVAIRIEGIVNGKNVGSILTNISKSSMSGGVGRSSSRSRSSSKRRRSSRSRSSSKRRRSSSKRSRSSRSRSSRRRR